MAYSTTDGHHSGQSAQRVEPPRHLNGLKSIAEYMGMSTVTVGKLIREEGLPASKIGGSWVSEAGRIDQWRLSRIETRR